MTVNWSDHAIDRLRCHIRYIAENSDLETASRWHARLNETTGLLASFPTMYPLSSVPSLASLGIHEISYGNYRVFYIIRDEECRIISILHGRQSVTYICDL